MNRDGRDNAGLFLLLSALGTGLLYVLPYGHTIGYPLVLVSTLAHELGHGIAGMLVGGSFRSFELFADASGVAHVSGDSGRFARAFVAAGGLVGPAVAAAIGFAMARRPTPAKAMLLVSGGLLLLANVLLVRNLFGLVFIGGFAAVLVIIALGARPWVSQLTLLFLSVQLALSVFSRGDYLFTDAVETGAGRMPSDVANMAASLWLPYWFWGAVCGAFSVLVLVLGAFVFLRAPSRPHASAGFDGAS